MGRSGISLLDLEETIGYSFSDKQLLTEALSHSSYVNELKMNKTACYERLEFLGDSILEFVSSDHLLEIYPDFTEGQLSKHRAALVCEKALSACARKIELGQFIKLGKGEAKNCGYDKDSILCDVMESLIGAIYKDGGFEAARSFIFSFILKDDDTSHYTDYKTRLQELVQGENLGLIEYELLGVTGPDHDRIFEVRLLVGGKELGRGSGTNKKCAEQAAASKAIDKITKGAKECI